jgi:hypothetical protein
MGVSETEVMIECVKTRRGYDVHQEITLSRIGASIFNDILKDTNKRYLDPETHTEVHSVGMNTHWIRKIKGPMGKQAPRRTGLETMQHFYTPSTAPAT